MFFKTKCDKIKVRIFMTKIKFVLLFSFIMMILSCSTFNLKNSDNDENLSGSEKIISPDKLFSVKNDENGLFITKKHSLKFTHIKINIKNKNGKEFKIVTTEKENEFLFPFVNQNEEYEISLEMMDKNYQNYTTSKNIKILAKNGFGEFLSDYYYDEENIQIVLENCNLEKFSDFDFSNFMGIVYFLKDGHIDYSSAKWSSYDSISNKIDLSPLYKDFSGKEFCVEICTKVTYQNKTYEFMVVQNNEKNSFKDNHSIIDISCDSGVFRPIFNPKKNDYKIYAAKNNVNLIVKTSTGETLYPLDFSSSENQNLKINNIEYTFTRDNTEKFDFEGKTYYQTFYDDFEGTELNFENWKKSAEEERQSSQKNHGWWKDECSYLENGNLVIEAKIKNGKNISGAIESKGLFEQSHGYYEIKFKCEKTSGLWYAFWLMGNNDDNHIGNGATDAAEIDCFELVPNEPWNGPNYFKTTINWDSYGEFRKAKDSGPYKVGNSFYDDFHTAIFIWGDTNYDFYLDGKLLWSLDASKNDENHFGGMCNGKNWIIISSEFGEWGGELKSDLLPAKMYVDYVKCGAEIN